jgi:hypothetical protein
VPLGGTSAPIFSTFSPDFVVRRTVARGWSSPTALGSTWSIVRVFSSVPSVSSRWSTAKVSARAASGPVRRHSAEGSGTTPPFLAFFSASRKAAPPTRSSRTGPFAESIATAVTSSFSKLKTCLPSFVRSSLDGSFRS